jgi:hypothetical protein
MNDQLIGITGVFVVTVSLFLLRQFILSIGRPNRNRYVTPVADRQDRPAEIKATDDPTWAAAMPGTRYR